MQNNAISVANEFIKLAKIDHVTDLTFLKLRNLVYKVSPSKENKKLIK